MNYSELKSYRATFDTKSGIDHSERIEALGTLDARRKADKIVETNHYLTGVRVVRELPPVEA